MAGCDLAECDLAECDLIECGSAEQGIVENTTSANLTHTIHTYTLKKSISLSLGIRGGMHYGSYPMRLIWKNIRARGSCRPNRGSLPRRVS